MFRRRGVTLTKALLTAVCMLAAPLTQAISVGNLTFSLPSETDFVSKRVVNNNKSARIYRIAISAIDSPGSSELRTRPVDGELLFAPRQLALQAGESEYFKFYYHGPRDNRERYYRVSFREVPTRNQTRRSPTGGEVSTEPVVVMDTILVVRPRQVQFKWSFDKVTGTVSNTGNTWFKLLIKPGCDSTEEEGDAWYLRPGDVVHQPELRQPGNHYLVYNDKFIKISDSCPAKPPFGGLRLIHRSREEFHLRDSNNRLNDVEAIVNVTCNDGLSHMYTIVFRRHGKVPGSLLTSGLFTN